MANEKYSQVTDLLAQGKLNWEGHNIEACLVTGATFDEDNRKFSELDSPVVAKAMIQGRVVAPGGECLGYSVFFPTAEAEVPYQVVVIQNLGNGDGESSLLVWYDTAEDGGPLEMENVGTLVIRPQVPAALPDGISTEARVWMRV